MHIQGGSVEGSLPSTFSPPLLLLFVNGDVFTSPGYSFVQLQKAESELSAVNIVAFRDMAQQLAEAQRKAAEEGKRQGEMASILAKMMTDMPQAQEELAGT